MPHTLNPDTPFPGASPEDESPVVDPGPAIDFDAVVFPENGEIAPEKQREETAVERCPNCAEAEKGRLMALAELENARKRLAREKEEFIKYAGEGVIADILPALDNLDLALAYAPQSEDCRNFVIGVDMTRKLLLDALTRRGLQQTGELGEDFDPACHEAVGMEAHPEYADGQVCALLSKGYRMKERLLRPAKVKVCKKDGL